MSLDGNELPDELAEIISIHRALFGGFTMMADEAGDDAGDDSQEEAGDDAKDSADAGGEAKDDSEDDFDPARALAKIKKLNSENRNLRKAKDEAEARAKGTDVKDTRIKALEAENLRIRIGARHGLPDELIDRLKGDTEEEILADAEKLLALVAGRKAPTQRPKENLRGGGNPNEEPDETDPRKLAAKIPRR